MSESEAPSGKCVVERLLSRAREGHQPSLGELLLLYREYLRLLARVHIGRHLQRRFDASDIVQEALLKAHTHFAHFRGQSEGELIAWLRRVLASSLSNAIRFHQGAEKRAVGLEADFACQLDDLSQVLDHRFARSSPSQRVQRREQQVLVANALARLPAYYREVLVLRQLEGKSFPEIALKMGRSVSGAQKLCARALVRFRDEWEHHDDDR